jgi:hypothetical protein
MQSRTKCLTRSLQSRSRCVKHIRVCNPTINLRSDKRSFACVCQCIQVFVVLHPIADVLQANAGEKNRIFNADFCICAWINYRAVSVSSGVVHADPRVASRTTTPAPAVICIVIKLPRLAMEKSKPLHCAIRGGHAIHVVVGPSCGAWAYKAFSTSPGGFAALVRPKLSSRPGTPRQPCVVSRPLQTASLRIHIVYDGHHPVNTI